MPPDILTFPAATAPAKPARSRVAARARTISVAIHDVEPATFERCALIRDWLGDHGVDHVTLLVIPAPDLHPFHDRCPELAEWLGDQVRSGDAVAQHGLEHARQAGGDIAARLRRKRGAEFADLDPAETRRALYAGRRVLKLAGVEPRGFVAPAYAYTPALRDALGDSFDWWASLLGVHSRPHAERRTRITSPAVGLSTASAPARALSPVALRAGSLLAGRNLRVDLHPADLRQPRHMLALEWVLRHGARRAAVTYDELVSA